MRTYQSWLLNNGIIPAAGAVFALAGEVQTAVGVLAELLVLAAAMRAPRLLRPGPMLVGTLVSCALGATLLCLAPVSVPGVVAGLVLRVVGSLFGFYLLAVALSRLASASMMAASASSAVLVATLIATFSPVLDLRASVTLDAALTLATIALTWRVARPTLEEAAKGPGGAVEALTNPRSFLLPNHQVFVLMLIFSVAVGFGSSLRIDGFVPLSNGAVSVALLSAVILFALAPVFDGRGRGRDCRRGRERSCGRGGERDSGPGGERDRGQVAGERAFGGGREDRLFVASALLIVAGFLAVPLEGMGTGTANSVLFAGKLSFSILSWTALAALCARNPAGSVMVLACGEVMSGAGAFMGFELGHLCNDLLASHPQDAAVVTSVAVLVLFAYAITGLHGFSFTETIRGVEPAVPLSGTAPAAPSHDKMLDAACDRIAGERLTDRECEVLRMLARGYNGYRIRDELGLSYNTVKTHVKRIYQKLDVHSHQEVIDLVEREIAHAGWGAAA